MKQHKKWIVILAALCLAAGGLLGLHYWKVRSENKTWSLVYIPKTEDGTNDFWTSLLAGTRMAAKEYGVSLEIMAPDREQDIEGQNRLIARATEMRPDALLISPSSFTESEALLKEAKEQGIHVVYIDSYTEHEIQDLTVATDNLKAGRELGAYAATLVGDDSRIAVVCHVKGVSTAVEREQGFREGLGDKAENIAEVVYCDSLFEKAYELTMELLEKYPDLELIAGLNEYSSVGAARAVRDSGMEGRVKVVGIDSSQEAVELMEQGVFQGLVLQKAFKMGYLGLKETVRLLRGEKVEKNTDSGCELVTLDNMYTSEHEKLLFPFDSAYYQE